ncbi:MAG: ABC transporter ATP-binding protein [Rhizobiaceae bacterium]|nr:ABC transporter ATP-binding protein [Rhizobiaceae bacterium]
MSKELQAPILSVSGLTVTAGSGAATRELVSDLSFDLMPGETLAIAGESGSGKSMTSLAIMGLLPKPGVRRGAGSIRLAGGSAQPVDIAALPEADLRRIRGDRIAMIFQEPMTSLNPVLSIGRQLMEVSQAHARVSSREARRLALDALDLVRIPDARRRLDQHPHELSGGQRQRVMIAMALLLRPDVLIADEPTTALDVTVQAQVLGLLRDLQTELGTAILLITHDMGVVAEMAERVLVMRDGRKVEAAATAELFTAATSDYARALLAAVPRIGSGANRIGTRGIEAATPAVEVKNLVVRFPLTGGLLGRPVANVHAVDGVSFTIAPGETLSLVGESGCGKSTTAKALAGLTPYMGDILVGGRDIGGLARAQAQAMRREVQMVFQDPYASLDPRMTIGEAIREPLDIHRIGSRSERSDRVEDLAKRVGLPPDSLKRYPHQFSGGQRQRISIARALALKPRVILCDESVSALDVSIQARVLDLLKELQAESGVAYLFISHDMAVVENISNRVAVMYAGRIVETGSRDQVFSAPAHPYTRRLIDAVPVPDPARRRASFPRLDGDVPSATRPIGYKAPAVRWRQVADGHWVAGPASPTG